MPDNIRLDSLRQLALKLEDMESLIGSIHRDLNAVKGEFHAPSNLAWIEEAKTFLAKAGARIGDLKNTVKSTATEERSRQQTFRMAIGQR